jgi:two-component system sensor histidine kinase CpxA
MRSLFIKIFLWFWVAMALVSFASLLSTMATESHPFFTMPWLRFLIHPPQEGRIRAHSGSFLGGWINSTGNVVKLSGETAVQVYDSRGAVDLLAYVNRLELTARIRLFLFNDRGEQITRWEVPKEVQELAARSPNDGLEFKRLEESVLLSERIPGPDGNRYSFVAELPTRHFFSRDYSVLLVNLVVILITAGAVCYWLARYIADPVARLGAAARRLADGDLKVRVGRLVGKRHDEIADLGKDFDLMAERIESLMTTQRRLLRDISHEFRSPLTRLSIALEIARQRDGAAGTDALGRIEREAGRLNELIGKLLTLARLDSGAEDLVSEPVDMTLLLEEIVADADFEAQKHNCAVRLFSNEQCAVQGNRELLRSAIENIVRNAVRYTAENTEVNVSMHLVDHRAVVQVLDHGPGVPEESLADLFYPFYRVGDARDRKEGGTGLGLAITDRAVRLHGGTVAAANAPGGGLMITVDLPAGTMDAGV